MKVLSVFLATGLVVASAFAQTSTTTTATTSGGTSDSAATNASNTSTAARGTVVEYSPGTSLVLSTGSGEPLHFRFGKTVTYINDEGRTIDTGRIKKNMIARVFYTRQGDDMVIDKLILSD